MKCNLACSASTMLCISNIDQLDVYSFVDLKLNIRTNHTTYP